MDDNSTLLSVKNVSTYFFTEEGVAKAVQDVTFSIKKGRTFALVGESGCGKSVTALSIMRLVPAPPGKIVGGEIVFACTPLSAVADSEGGYAGTGGKSDLLQLSKKQMRAIRGSKIAMIFQEPMTSLNPVYTVGNQIVEAIRLHQRKSASQAWADAVEMLRKAGIADAGQRVHDYPHHMSGGMRQRVMIAMAVSCEPALLIADEPTTALDVTIQAQILDLLDELQKQNGMSILLITHDLGVVAERADDVAVMYASRIVEVADSQKLFAEPLHPYTQGLLKSLPRLGYSEPERPCSGRLREPPPPTSVSAKRLLTIPGTVPEPLHFPAGCKFHPRCPIGNDDKRCQIVEPPLRQVQSDRCVACWYASGYEK